MPAIIGGLDESLRGGAFIVYRAYKIIVIKLREGYMKERTNNYK